LDGIQEANNARVRHDQDRFLRRATVVQFIDAAERIAQAVEPIANGECDSAGEWGECYMKAFWPLTCLRRAKEVRPVRKWPDEALQQRDLLADSASLLLIGIGAVPGATGTLKPEAADKAFVDFKSAMSRLKELASLQSSRAAVEPQGPGTGRFAVEEKQERERGERRRAGNAQPSPAAVRPMPPNSDSTVLPDGPFDLDGFRYKNVEVRFGRAAKQRSLVLALWDNAKRRPRDARLIEDVLSEVYGEEHTTEDAAFRQLCSDTRGRFERACMPLTIETTQGRVQLSTRRL
jgi:hypothetical protein